MTIRIGVIVTLLLVTSTVARASSPKVEALVTSLANGYNIDSKLVLAIIEVESKGNVFAVGRTHGEIGLMQLRPNFFPEVSFGIYSNIVTGIQYLAYLRERKISTWGDAWFVAYNVGPNARLDDPFEFPYYKKVMEVYGRLEQKPLCPPKATKTGCECGRDSVGAGMHSSWCKLSYKNKEL